MSVVLERAGRTCSTNSFVADAKHLQLEAQLTDIASFSDHARVESERVGWPDVCVGRVSRSTHNQGYGRAAADSRRRS